MVYSPLATFLGGMVLARFLLKKTTSDILKREKGELVMLSGLTSSGLMHMALDSTQELSVLGIGLLALVAVSGAMIVAVAAAETISRHLAHGH
jgi:hypothetical protein